jgi:diaminohydroxyphosphoribosylaminopyrimidine deaminase/5-amino-6-(5-phosphoribosylamino)uracil reductase
MTLDGQIATASGAAKWITGKQSRQEVHRLRSCVDAVLVGIGTVLTDDSALTARVGPRLNKLASKQPLRIVVDSALRIPLNAAILSNQERAKTVVATTESASASRKRALLRRGIEVLTLPDARGKVSLPAVMRELGRRGVTSLLVEGGGEINAAMLKAKLVRHVRLYMAPALLGGVDAKGLIGGKSPARLTSALRLRNVTTRFVGSDLLVEGDL